MCDDLPHRLLNVPILNVVKPGKNSKIPSMPCIIWCILRRSKTTQWTSMRENGKPNSYTTHQYLGGALVSWPTLADDYVNDQEVWLCPKYLSKAVAAVCHLFSWISITMNKLWVAWIPVKKIHSSLQLSRSAFRVPTLPKIIRADPTHLVGIANLHCVNTECAAIMLSEKGCIKCAQPIQHQHDYIYFACFGKRNVTSLVERTVWYWDQKVLAAKQLVQDREKREATGLLLN